MDNKELPKAPVVDGMSPEAKENLARFLAKFYSKRINFSNNSDPLKGDTSRSE